jgi:hypothetical protein
MTPQELMALYTPFLLNFFLIWLTNLSERKTIGSREKEKTAGFHRNETTGKARHPHWNVSSFLT